MSPPLTYYSPPFVGVGYLMGPVVGSYFWRMTHRKAMNLIEIKDREFHNRIVKNRVDPSVQSPTNPLPDFYGESASADIFIVPFLIYTLSTGEKIGSLHQYRHVGAHSLLSRVPMLTVCLSGLGSKQNTSERCSSRRIDDHAFLPLYFAVLSYTHHRSSHSILHRSPIFGPTKPKAHAKRQRVQMVCIATAYYKLYNTSSKDH